MSRFPGIRNLSHCTDFLCRREGPVACVVKDAFLVELGRCLEDVPEMNERNKKKFVKKLQMYFLLSLAEELFTPIAVVFVALVTAVVCCS